MHRSGRLCAGTVCIGPGAPSDSPGQATDGSPCRSDDTGGTRQSDASGRWTGRPAGWLHLSWTWRPNIKHTIKYLFYCLYFKIVSAWIHMICIIPAACSTVCYVKCWVITVQTQSQYLDCSFNFLWVLQWIFHLQTLSRELCCSRNTSRAASRSAEQHLINNTTNTLPVMHFSHKIQEYYITYTISNQLHRKHLLTCSSRPHFRHACFRHMDGTTVFS